MNDLENIDREIEKLNGELDIYEGKVKYYSDKEKIILAQMKNLNRRQRTHRLCSIGGPLEKYLQRPQDFTVDDVQDFLNFVFSVKDVQEYLKSFLKGKSDDSSGGRRKLKTTCFNKCAIIHRSEAVIAFCRRLLAESRLINQSGGSAPEVVSQPPP